MPTCDNLTDMDNWPNRRDEARRNFIANRESAQEHANANIARTPMTTAEAGGQFAPAPRRPITARDIQRTLDQAGIAHTPGDGRAIRMPGRD